ncbi:MAG: DUF3717 domain-containing protein [Burkholderiaceae bacterium]
MTPIKISDLEKAINHARQALPAEGQAAALSTDVGLLADIYGQLIFLGHKAFDADSLEPPVRAALFRWISLNEIEGREGEGRAA